MKIPALMGERGYLLDFFFFFFMLQCSVLSSLLPVHIKFKTGRKRYKSAVGDKSPLMSSPALQNVW